MLVTEVDYLTIGPYHAALTFEYGKSAPQTITANVSVIIVPIHLVVVAVIVIVLLFIGWRINRRIITLNGQSRFV